jgi:hypothetical protein
MLSLEDSRWNGLKGGYGAVFDPDRCFCGYGLAGTLTKHGEHFGRTSIIKVMWGWRPNAAVPYLVQTYRDSGVFNWNVYGIVVTIELARDSKRNPPIPEWLEDSYLDAIDQLAQIGSEEIMRSTREAMQRERFWASSRSQRACVPMP